MKIIRLTTILYTMLLLLASPVFSADNMDRSFQSDLDFARKAINDGFYDMAENKLAGLLDQKLPSAVEAETRLLMGRMFYEKSQPAKALAEFNIIRERFANSGFAPGAVYWTAEVYFKDGSYEQALENYEKAKPLLEETLLGVKQRYGAEHIKFAQILQNLGEIYFLEGQMESAASATHKALKIFLKNKDPEIYVCLEKLADISIKQSSIAFNDGAHQESQELNKQAVDYLKRALEGIKTNKIEPLAHTRLQDKLNKLE